MSALRGPSSVPGMLPKTPTAAKQKPRGTRAGDTISLYSHDPAKVLAGWEDLRGTQDRNRKQEHVEVGAGFSGA